MLILVASLPRRLPLSAQWCARQLRLRLRALAEVICQGAAAALCSWTWALHLAEEPNEVLMDTCILNCMTSGDWAKAPTVEDGLSKKGEHSEAPHESARTNLVHFGAIPRNTGNRNNQQSTMIYHDIP